MSDFETVNGVNWHNRTNKYRAQIWSNGKTRHLGYFDNYEDAVKARKDAEEEYGHVPITAAPKLKHRNDLTQEMLKSLLHYNPDKGIFTWKVKTAHIVKVGDVAGSTDNRGYVRIMIDNKNYKAHQLAFLYMNGKFPGDGLEVDHINQIRNDNRWINLRIVTSRENSRNKSMQENNTSGHLGVHWGENVEKWMSSIRDRNGNREHLGCFDNIEDAIAAREAAEIKYGYHENHGKQINQTIGD